MFAGRSDGRTDTGSAHAHCFALSVHTGDRPLPPLARSLASLPYSCQTRRRRWLVLLGRRSFVRCSSSRGRAAYVPPKHTNTPTPRTIEQPTLLSTGRMFGRLPLESSMDGWMGMRTAVATPMIDV